jgi:autotransporter-associated beta strand protein
MKLKHVSSLLMGAGCASRFRLFHGTLVMMLSGLATAQTWNGAGGDDFFGTGSNWIGGATPSVGSGVVLQFGASSRLTPNNNYTTGDDFGEWRLLSSAGASYTISGNGFGLHSKIENDAGSGQTLTINTAGIYARNNIEINPVGGNIVVGALTVLDNNRSLNVYDGDNGNTLTINGVLSNGNGSGGNGSLILNQKSTVILAADGNTYGTSTINTNAILRVGAGGATGSLGSGDVTNNGSLVFHRTGNLTVANNISGSGSVTLQSGNETTTFSTRKTYTGNTVINGGILDLTGGGGQDGTIRGTVTVNNGGTLRLSVNDATGWGTGAQRITSINLNEGGALHVNTTANQTFSNMAITLQGATISGIAGSTFDFFNGSTSLTTLASATTSTVSMNSRLRQPNTTFTVADGAAAVDLLWSGQLNQDGGARNFIKEGAGRMNITAATSYAGTTTVNAGYLAVSSTMLNTSGIAVNNGSTLELGATNMFVGGHGTAVDNSRVITVNGSTLLMNGNMDSRIGNVTLNDGSTWTSNRGLAGWDVLLANTSTGAATVNVTGTGKSTMNGSGGIHLSGQQNFNVADTVAGADVDLEVTMRLDNGGNVGGTGGIRKLGAGTMLLDNLSNSYSGDITIDDGAIRTGTAQGPGTSGYLGTVNGTRTITVNTGATLDMRANNQFGGSGKSAATIPQIVANGGTVSSTRFNILGNVTLNGATLTHGTSDTGSYEGYQFLGSITVGGTAPSTISSSNGRANHLINGTTTFDVANATGDAAADLTVSAPLRNASGDYGSGVGSIEKTGVGTMVISSNSIYTGTTTVSAGTLLVIGTLGTSSTNTGAVSVASGATLGGTGDIFGSVSLAGDSFLTIVSLADPLKITGSVTFGSGFGIDNLLGVDWDALALDTKYTLISDTATTFDASAIENFGITNKVAVGSLGRFAYFDNGSLAVYVVPETSTTMLGLTGLLGLALRRRRLR